jgi:hypothetical protein
MVATRRELLRYAGLALFTPLIGCGTRGPQPVGKWILVTTGDARSDPVGKIGRWRAIRWRDGGLEMGTVAARAPDDPRLPDERALAGTCPALPPIHDEWHDDGLVYRAFPDCGGVSLRQLWLDSGRPRTPPWQSLWAAIGEAFCIADEAGCFARTTWKVCDFVLTWEGRLILVPFVAKAPEPIASLLRCHTLATEHLGEPVPNPFGSADVIAALERASARAPSLDASVLRDFIRGASPAVYRDELAMRDELRQLGEQQIIEIEKTGT